MSIATGLTEENLHAELGQIVAGLKPGRQNDTETNLFWHIAAQPQRHSTRPCAAHQGSQAGIGQELRFI